jgi:hypothetical protein
VESEKGLTGMVSACQVVGAVRSEKIAAADEVEPVA